MEMEIGNGNQLTLKKWININGGKKKIFFNKKN